MCLKSQLEYEHALAKLRLLEETYDAMFLEEADDDELRQAELESLRRLINQFKEEIAW